MPEGLLLNRSFLVWPGGEAVKPRPRPVASRDGRLHSLTIIWPDDN